MGKMTFEDDIIAMALLYRKKYANTDMISYDKIKKFDNVLNSNLENLNIQFPTTPDINEQSKLYSFVKNEDDITYVVINQNIDLNEYWSYHIGCLPLEIVIASQLDNALKEIGLIKINNKIQDRNKYYNLLSIKHNLPMKEKSKVFDVFKDWENVPENGFVEKYCISEEEISIIQDLRENKRQNDTLEAEQIMTLKRERKN